MTCTVTNFPYRRMGIHCINMTMTSFRRKGCIITTVVGDLSYRRVTFTPNKSVV